MILRFGKIESHGLAGKFLRIRKECHFLTLLQAAVARAFLFSIWINEQFILFIQDCITTIEEIIYRASLWHFIPISSRFFQHIH